VHRALRLCATGKLNREIIIRQEPNGWKFIVSKAAIAPPWERHMKFLIAAAAIATVAATCSPASAAMMACTSENMMKSMNAGGAMPDSPGKMGMMKEMAMANTQMSKGDMRGACKSYMKAQKMGMMKSSM
jgi:hypothetical protein